MQADDETPPSRPRWQAWALIAFMLLVVLGMLNLGVRILLSGAASAGAGVAGVTGSPVGHSAAPGAPSAVALVGRSLVEGSDCLRCHGMDRHYVGPSFRQIAARYRERADAPDYLARKIRDGSVGEWGRTLMPRHLQVTEAQAREMAQWLLSLPPAQASVVGADAGPGPR